MGKIVSNIFAHNNLTKAEASVQKIRYNREQLLTTETAVRLNTYLNFGVFPTYTDTTMPTYKDGKLTEKSQQSGTPGVRSLFNRAGAVLLGSSDGKYDEDFVNNAHGWRIANNVPLMDSVENRQKIRKTSGCSVKELVQSSSEGLMGQETYDYSDFMYCKHLGKVSNNYMITLRRFPLPVDDYIGALDVTNNQKFNEIESLAAKNASCIGCMVTWMGVSGNEMSSILKYNYKMGFEWKTADRQSLSNGPDADTNNTLFNNIASMLDPAYRQAFQEGKADSAASGVASYLGIKGFESMQAPYKDYAKNYEDSNKVYGPIDVVKSTYVRSDAGLEFNQSITLVFEYELRAYNGINAKQAMLDLISNILNVTYTTGTFWGGGYKGFAAPQSSIFSDLQIFKAKGGFTNFIDAFSKDINTGSNKLKETFKGKSPLEVVGNFINTAGGMFMSAFLNKFGRPQKSQFISMLSPAPIGFWHVTIGNPKRPIMSIGNMIITDCSVEHSGPLGLDDFPTGLKVTVTLERGKPRDLRDIEKLYMQGHDRIYSSMGAKVFDMYKNAELYNHDFRMYRPVSLNAEMNNTKSEPTMKVENYTSIKNTMKKYFGTTDEYSIYVPAAEQEFGSGKKKPSTENNGSLVGGDGNTAKTGGYYGNGK